MSRYRVYYTQTIGDETLRRGYHYSTSGYKDVEARDKKHAFMRFQNEMLKFGVENFKTFKITDIQDIIIAFSSSYYGYFSDNNWEWEYHTTADSTRMSINSTAVETTMAAPTNTIYYHADYAGTSFTLDSLTGNLEVDMSRLENVISGYNIMGSR